VKYIEVGFERLKVFFSEAPRDRHIEVGEKSGNMCKNAVASLQNIRRLESQPSTT
jgi:hypothetical protein